MNEYKRLTKKDWHETKFSKVSEYEPNDRVILKRLWDLENKIENGTFVELPCKGIEELDIIKKGMIFIFYKMCLEQNLGQGVFLKYKSKINEWFESYLKNKELQEKQDND